MTTNDTGHRWDNGRVLAVSLAAVVVYAAAIGAVGYTAMDRSWAPSAMETDLVGGGELGLLAIIVTNVGAALLLFAGVATGGLATLAGATWTSGYVGATLAVAVENVGGQALLQNVWLYLPLELAALVVAAAAGIHPVVAMVLHASPTAPPAWRRYVNAWGTSLRLLALSVLLIGLSAIAEVLTGA